MIKKVFIGIIAAGMILTTIPTVNAEDEITLDEVTDQIIDISDKYNSAGVTSGQLLNLITLTQTDDELLDAISLDKNDLFDTSIPKKVNIQSSRSGDPYDGNPPASKEEQKERMKYIRSVYNKEYNDGNHDESIYTIYLYTSHYIENINYDKSFSDEKNFGHPVYANIISQNDIDAYEQFYKAQTGVAIYKAFRTCTNGIKNYKENFYFQKVTIDNYFRKNMNKPKNMLKKDKLSINIIYVKSNQSYFTYDSDTGNDKNQIIDPIAVIYTGGVDSSCIASMYAGDTVSGSIYFEDNSKKQGRAYRKVEALEQELGIYQFNSVTNIYGQAASNLVIIRQKVMWQSAILLAVILCSIVFITIAVSGYYFSKQQRLLLEALWGYGYMSSIKEIILVFIGINLCTTAVVYIIKHNVVVWYFMIIACIIEIIVTKLEYDYLSKKNLHEKIINGEQW